MCPGLRLSKSQGIFVVVHETEMEAESVVNGAARGAAVEQTPHTHEGCQFWTQPSAALRPFPV